MGCWGSASGEPFGDPVAKIIDTANEKAAKYQIPVVAVDLPSGIDADTGD